VQQLPVATTMSNAGLCRMAAARVALTALSATLFGIITETPIAIPLERANQLSEDRVQAPITARILVRWVYASLDCAGPERRAQLPVGPSSAQNLGLTLQNLR
jgi:hypothetical protein